MTTWADIVLGAQQGAQMYGEMQQGVPEQNFNAAKSMAELIFPTTPEDVALELLGGPAAKMGGAAMGGVLKAVPWEKATTRLPDLRPYAERMKNSFNQLLARTNNSGNEWGQQGIVDARGNLLAKRNEGDSNSVTFWNQPENYNKVLNKNASYDFHTHPEQYGQVNVAQPSDVDLLHYQRRNIQKPLPWKEDPFEYVPDSQKAVTIPGTLRGNQENIIASPNKDYFWWTLPKDTPRELLKPIRSEEAFYKNLPPTPNDFYARILYGAKKGHWDVQTNMDTRAFGVKP